jgi:dihydropteroate synthase
MQGEPRTMQHAPAYGDVVSEVAAFLEERLAFAVAAGIPEERICLDPGIGFGKTVEHNLEVLRRLEEICALGRPVVVGTSRKGFLGRITGRPEGDRLAGTIATNVMALERGALRGRAHFRYEVSDRRALLEQEKEGHQNSGKHASIAGVVLSEGALRVGVTSRNLCGNANRAWRSVGFRKTLNSG